MLARFSFSRAPCARHLFRPILPKPHPLTCNAGPISESHQSQKIERKKMGVAGIFALGKALRPFHHRPGQSKCSGYFLGPHNHGRCRLPWSALFGTDAEGHNRDYLVRILGVSNEKIDKESGTRGNILTLEIGVLEGRVDWLRERLSLKENEMKKIVHKNLSILQLRSEDNLKPKLDYLQKRLSFDDSSLRKIMLKFPQVFSCSIEDSIAPTLDWLHQRLGLDSAVVSKTVKQHPALLCLNVDTNLESKLVWLQERLGFDDATVRKMIKRLPTLFSCNVDTNLEPKLDWLQKRLCLEDAAVSKFVQQCPPLLGCNVRTNLEPTLNFYIGALGEEEAALALVKHDPSLFSYSLKNRLTPRLEEARNIGIIIDSGCLQRIAKYTDDQWHSSLCSEAQNFKIRPQKSDTMNCH